MLVREETSIKEGDESFITTNSSKFYLRVIRTVVLTRVVVVTLVRTLIVLVAIVPFI